MDNKNNIRKSKWLSKHLRHAPEEIGLKLEEGGWVSVDELLDAASRFKIGLTRSELEQIVAESDKQRFGFNAGKTKIRANQGHSVEVDLALEPTNPPAVLFHGTSAQNRDLLLHEGLKKMRRHHVHLSADVETAIKVGARHGKPLIFEIDTQKMSADGHLFYVSDNGVWLSDEVPPQYLKLRG